jgi:hypothetical protein
MPDEKKIDIIKSSKPFSLWDIIVASLLVVFSIIFVVFSCANREEGSLVVVSFERTQNTFDISSDFVLEINFESGEILQKPFSEQHSEEEQYVIVCKDREVWVAHSDCPSKQCVKRGKIKYSGQKIVCAFHGVVIEIESEDSEIIGSVG